MVDDPERLASWREQAKKDAAKVKRRMQHLPDQRRRWTELEYETGFDDDDELLRDLPGSGDDPFFDDVFKR